MTKKHYEAIAKILRRARLNATKEQHYVVDVIVQELTDYMASDNFNFDRVRFLEACGIEPLECDILVPAGMWCSKHSTVHK